MNQESGEEGHSSEGTSPESETSKQKGSQGPTFQEAPDPLAGVKKTSKDVWDSMDGKTVSMRTYVGSILGVIALMLLARCGG